MTRFRLILAAARLTELHALRDLVASQSDLEIVGDARSLRETFNQTEMLDPDLVVVASELARLPEFDAMVKLFAALDTRWLEFGGGDMQSAIGQGGTSGLFRLDPTSSANDVLARIRAVLDRPRRRRTTGPRAQVGAHPRDTAGPERFQRLVMIGSSTGGVEALMTILSAFPADCPPTVIVQHTGTGYGTSLAKLLDRNSAAEVREAEDGMPVRPGRVILAAGCGRHMKLRRGGAPAVRLQPGPPEKGHCPSVDVLFNSARSAGARSVGVLLTGMGSDGAEGLLGLRQAGAVTLAQDAASSLVYGMPKAAWNSGAVCRRVHIDQMAQEILRHARIAASGRAAG